MNELTVTLMQGLQASGKSTWAEQQVGDGRTVRISLDDLRKMFNNTYWQKEKKIRERTETFVLQMRNHMILDALMYGSNVIVDAMHLSPKHIKFVTEQLNKAKGSITDFSKCLARALKKYIPDDSEIQETCPSCQNIGLVYEEGCYKCKNCGWSKC